LRNRVTERERYLIESREHATSGDLTRDIETCVQWVTAYPNDVQGHNHLGLDYLLLGQHENAARQFREALAVAPDNAAARVNLSSAYRRSGRFDEARRVLDSPAARRIDNEAIRVQRYMLAFLDGDRAAMEEQMKQAEGRPGYEDNLLLEAACVEEYHGRFAKARELHARARTSAEKAGGVGRAAGYLADQAMDEGHVGNFAMAKRLATQGLTGPNARNVLQRNALALAVAGDNATAARLLQELTTNPRDLLVQNFAAPTIHAYIEMNNGNPAKAIEILRAALPYDLAMTEFSSLQPAYARGLAYLQLRQGAQAAREFQKLIDNPGAVYASILGALARLQRGRARVVSGDLDAARTDYQDFLALWKDADPDVPVLRQAKAEYEKIK
jgi:tetratricopeptide (TPR) repeat protein